MILALTNKLEEKISFKIFTNDIVKSSEYFLTNNFFEFNNEIKITGPAIGTTRTPPHDCIDMDKTMTDFLYRLIDKWKKVKFGQKLKNGRKQASVGVPFVVIYHHKNNFVEPLLYQK